MAKTTAPLLGFGAAGQIGKTMVHASWRGVSYARRHVVPANPKTTSQSRTRGVFQWLSATWKLLPPNAQAPWTLFALGQPFTNRNAWVNKNLATLRGTDAVPVTVLTTMIGSPGAKGGLAPAAMVLADAGAHHVTATLTAPALPTGWAIVAQHAIAMKQQDAHVDKFYTSYYATDAVAPYAADITLPSAMTCVVSSWFEFTKADGSICYGPSLTAQQIVA